MSIKASKERWTDIFKYLREHKEVEDVVISGGDAYRLKASQIKEIGDELLKIDHIMIEDIQYLQIKFEMK